MTDLRVKLILDLIDRVTAPARNLRGRFTSNMSAMAAAAGRVSEKLRTMGRDLKGVGNSWNNVGQHLSLKLSAPALLAGRSTLKATKQMEALEGKMIAALGSTEAARKQIALMTSEAERMGVVFYDNADAAVGFMASITRAGFSVEQANDMLKDFVETTVSMKMSNDRISLVMRGLEQMASKPNVSMEELKEQLADHIPGAVQIAAKAMGMLPDAFIEATGEGAIKSKEFIPRYAKMLREELGGGFEAAAKGMQALENRAANDIFFQQQTVAARGLADAWKNVLSAVRSLARGFAGLSPQAQKYIVWAGMAAIVIGPLILGIGQFMMGIGALTTGIGMLIPWMVKLVALTSKFAVMLFTTPLGWFALGVAAIAGSAYLIYKNWGGITAWFSNLWNGIKTVFEESVNAVMDYLQPLLQAITTIMGGISKVGSSIGRGIKFAISSPASSPLAAAVPLGQPARSSIDTGGTLNIKIDSAGNPSVLRAQPNDPRMGYTVDSGPLMSGAY